MAITQDRLKELAHYDPATGAFTALTSRCNGRYKAGGPLGGLTGNPSYYVAKLDGKAYGMHRLAWLYVYGFLPDMIDHKDGNPHNNRIENLRPATTNQNAANKPILKSNTSGEKGVCWRASRSCWEAYVYVGGRRVFRKLFKDFNDACKAVRSARELHHGEFSNHG